MKRYKICLVCSAGGHLNQIKELIAPLQNESDTFLVTMDREDSRTLLNSGVRHYFVRDIRDNGNLFTNFLDSLKIFLNEKPDFVITTGAGAALSTCLIAKLFFKKVIFIESFARVEEPSSFGKLISKFADYTFFQWPKLQKFYQKGIYAGSIFNIDLNSAEQKKKQVFITVGSTEFQFNRLLQEVDNYVERGIIKHTVIAQVGSSNYVPKNFESFKWCNFQTMQKLMQESSYVITHSGTGSIVNALQLGAKVIAVPRLQKFKEHLDDHQLEIANEFEQLGLVMVPNEVRNLEKCINSVDSFVPSGSLNNTLFFKSLFRILNFKEVNSTSTKVIPQSSKP